MQFIILILLMLFPKTDLPSLKKSVNERYYVAFNPTENKIEMIVSCGIDWNLLYIDVLAHDYNEFRVTTYNEILPVCRMEGFKVIEKVK